MLSLDYENFHDEVYHNDGPVAVTFTAPGCGGCRSLKPVLDRWASKNNVKVGVVDVTESPELAEHFGVTALPATVFFAAGDARIKWVGVASEKQLSETLAEAIEDGQKEPAHHSH